MAEEERSSNTIRMGQRTWRDYEPIAQTRADLLRVFKFLQSTKSGGRGRVWASMRFSTSEDSAGYPVLRCQVLIKGPTDTLASLLKEVPNLRPKTRKARKRSLEIQQVLVAEKGNALDRS